MLSDGRDFLRNLEACADPDDLPLLVAACAGRVVFVPRRNPGSECWITLAIGQEKATELVRKLDEISCYGVHINVPFNGRGLYAMVKSMVRRRVIAGLEAGKGTNVVAVECGITPRAVQFLKLRLREEGLLACPEAEDVVQAKFFGVNSTTATAVLPNLDELGHAEEASGRNLSHAIEDALQARPSGTVRVSGPAGPDRGERIFALIEQTCGANDARRIREVMGNRPLRLGSKAVRKSWHPFRVVLGEVEAKLLAVKIIAAHGPKPEFLPNLSKIDGTWTSMSAHLREVSRGSTPSFSMLARRASGN